jgi:phi LC3 family holin
MKERLKNPILWGSILSTIFLILSALKVISIPDNTVNVIVNSILSILALIGVINSPTQTISNSSSEDETFNDSTDNKG